MFKNRAFQVKLVNTDKEKADDFVANFNTVEPEQIAKIATDTVVKTVGAIGAVIATHKVLSTICEIAVVAAKAKLK